jgi:hypothetical protein
MDSRADYRSDAPQTESRLRMREFKDFAELEAAVGTEIGLSDWIEITHDRINTFADATWDEQLIHVDEALAASSCSKTTIAHGLLALADPDVQAIDHRIERLEIYAELWRQPDSPSLWSPPVHACARVSVHLISPKHGKFKRDARRSGPRMSASRSQ